jgi:hypothetical protein
MLGDASPCEHMCSIPKIEEHAIHGTDSIVDHDWGIDTHDALRMRMQCCEEERTLNPNHLLRTTPGHATWIMLAVAIGSAHGEVHAAKP